MYRILVVDDESNVVDFICDLLEEQTEPELDVCRAYSANDALSWLNRARIDILMTDIRMPKMDGITLIKRVHQDWPRCKVIILTAYAQFEYAHEAIKNNVVSYILKDEDDEYIINTIKATIQILDEEINKIGSINSMKEQIDELTATLQSETLLGMLQNTHYNKADFNSHLHKARISINQDLPIMLFANQIDKLCRYNNMTEKMQTVSKVKAIIEHCLGAYFCCYSAEYSDNRLAWVIQPIKRYNNFHESLDAYVSGMLEMAQQTCKNSLGLILSFILHGSPIFMNNASEIFTKINRLLNSENNEKKGFIIRADNRIINQTNMQTQIDSNRELTSDNSAMNQIMVQDNGSLSDTVISIIKEYIGNNITEDTSLVRLSELTGYSTTYLSHLFKDKMGITLSNYIKEQKLNVIKKNMLDKKLNIGDVAKNAGFSSRTYFNNFLRRMTNMSPQEYRASLLYHLNK